MAKSFSNAYEVEMVAELVQYLIKGNSYDLGDIAVLVRDPFDLFYSYSSSRFRRLIMAN